ncbi:MAG: hypothetical protein V7K89_20310 [Nostoc sp.]|uniref:hypothetical protein n=1 Tax=Nostoc sp. TaxID=1180 RepID=UPI002FFB274C
MASEDVGVGVEMVFRQILKILLATSSVWLWVAISAAASEMSSQQVQEKSAIAKVLPNSRTIREIPLLSEIERPSTSAQHLVQLPTPTNPL